MSFPTWFSRDSRRSGRPNAVGKWPGRLGLVVEVDQQCLVEAGLDEAVRVPVVAGLEVAAVQEAGDVLDEDLGLEVRDRPGLRGREVGGVAEGEEQASRATATWPCSSGRSRARRRDPVSARRTERRRGAGP